MAADRALALLAAAGDSRPFPSAAVLRLEGELRLEEQRLARRAHIVIGLHAGALALSLALLAAVRFGEVALDARGAMFGSAGSICAIVVVVISIWNLAKSVGETALS
jgi:hypothetical protein